MEMAPPLSQRLVELLLKRRGLMNFLVRLKMTNARLKHTVNQALFITQQDEPVDAVRWMLAMNKDHVHSERVDQDVLLLGGENDAFQPPKLLYRQEQALVNARSITTRIFTREEHADQHCQMGNLSLVLEVIACWLDEKTRSSGREQEAP
jgi:hypothetical protein